MRAPVAAEFDAIASGAGADGARGIAAEPLDVLFDLGETAVAVRGGEHCLERDGLLSSDPAEEAERVDSVVEHGATAAEGFGEAPLAGTHIGTMVAVHGLDGAELAAADDLERLDVGGLVVQPIGDHQFDSGGTAGVDHAAALGGGDVHGLLAEDVLAGTGGADGVLGVHGVGEGDVDGVDGGVGGDAVEVLVGVDGGGGDVVLGGDALCLVAVAADESGDTGLSGLRGAAKEVVGDAAESDDGVADVRRPGEALGEGRGEAGGCERRRRRVG